MFCFPLLLTRVCVSRAMLTPMCYNEIRKKSGLTVVHVDTKCRPQTFYQDCLNFSQIGMTVINMWAYKDVALRCIDLVEDKPTQMFATNFADFETGLRYCFKLVIIAIILNGFAALKNIYLHSYTY